MRAIIYTRVSTDKQEAKGHSLEEQERLCMNYIEMQGWTYVRSYSDTGSGGFTDNRPGYGSMMETMGEEWDAVVGYKLDRFHRNTMNAIEFVNTIDNNDCHIACISEQMDTTTVQGRFFYIVFAALAELRRNEIKERVKMGMAGAKLKGIWLGTPPYGYDMNIEIDETGKRSKKGILVPNQHEAEIVNAIFRMDSKGHTISDIINQLAADGLRTRKGKVVWHRQTIKNILEKKNLYIYGTMEVDGETVKGIHPTIVSQNYEATEEE